ncbi:SAM-dependent methyltransferase [Paenibacillus sp. HB172176]|uniref:class I SAM-dependent methyltransferase n=1 Tax=Paenibacillus sp. HB172176 TaxID=2493690 RepID=UPI001438A1F3|nr:SAM-dependent methyltransferase [Paenibacillus sp. HB172176]
MTKSASSKLSIKIKQLINASTLRGYPHQAQPKAGVSRTVPCISFKDYMARCLYDEEFGYYRSGRMRIGKEGDFYTSASAGDVMATAIASYIAEHEAKSGGYASLIEWGAGTGKLAAAIVRKLTIMTCSDFHESKRGKRPPYICVENHPAHAEAIRNAFVEAELDASALRIRRSAQMEIEDEWPLDSQLIANELLDAFPVHRICRYDGLLWELGVACDEHNHLVYTRIPWNKNDEGMRQALEESGLTLAEGQTTELCPDAGDWIRQLGKRMKQGRVLLIDYGHEAGEYGAEHRMNGTLLTYARHQASDSPFEEPGRRDITAHVNFTAIRSAAASAGFRELYFDTQKQFLIDNGILDQLREHDGRDPFGETARSNRFIRQLLLSDGMSETFKVMILEKA